MNGAMAFLVATTTVLAIAAIGVSLFAVWRSQALALLVDASTRAGLEQCEGSLQALGRTVNGLETQIQDLPQQPAATGNPTPTAGLNLTKRSQVLRMHRRGDPSDQIAAALSVPRQEVDLLIKVHRIVIKGF